MPPFEVLLPLGAIGLYLFDSTLLLYSNELLFARRAGRWTFATSCELFLGGRRVLLPESVHARLRRSFESVGSEADTREEQESPVELDSFLAALGAAAVFRHGPVVAVAGSAGRAGSLGHGDRASRAHGSLLRSDSGRPRYIYARRRELRLSGKSFLALSFDFSGVRPFRGQFGEKVGPAQVHWRAIPSSLPAGHSSRRPFRH